MSSCDDRGLFAADKEMARRRSLSREPQAMPACKSLIQRSSCGEGIDAVSRKKAPGSAQTNESVFPLDGLKKKSGSHVLTSGYFYIGRGGEIRTHGLLYPKQARYQTAPRPDNKFIIVNSFRFVN